MHVHARVRNMPAMKKRNGQEKLKQSLREERQRLLDEIREDLFKRLREENSARYRQAMDAGDLSVASLLESLGFELAGIRQRELENLAQAERKIEDGTYGICEGCGEEISEERLAAMPFAVYCVPCMKRLESTRARDRDRDIRVR
jgi:DnaK suppressor protein